jgi:hypothetical protein
MRNVFGRLFCRAVLAAALAHAAGSAGAATYNLGALPTDGTVRTFYQSTRSGGSTDTYNFTLTQAVDAGAASEFLRFETVWASFDTVNDLFRGSNLSGGRIAVNDDNRYTRCGSYWCSTISVGADPGRRSTVVPSLAAGDYSLRVRGYSGATGDYRLTITSRQDVPVITPEPEASELSAVPLPASGLLLVGGLAGVAAWRRRKA